VQGASSTFKVRRRSQVQPISGGRGVTSNVIATSCSQSIISVDRATLNQHCRGWGWCFPASLPFLLQSTPLSASCKRLKPHVTFIKRPRHDSTRLTSPLNIKRRNTHSDYANRKMSENFVSPNHQRYLRACMVCSIVMTAMVGPFRPFSAPPASPSCIPTETYLPARSTHPISHTPQNSYRILMNRRPPSALS